jgi:cytochrome c oxidase subunit IV
VTTETFTDTGQEHTDEHAGEEGHGATDNQYIVIALILAAITAGEVTLSYIDVGPIFIPALLILMAIKFFMVVMYFMHLKFDNRIFSVLFYTGLGLAVFVYIVALTTFHFFT